MGATAGIRDDQVRGARSETRPLRRSHPVAERPFALSDALLQDLRAERVSACVLQFDDRVTLSAATIDEVVLYCILEGSLVLTVDDQSPVTLHVGECALLLLGDGHLLGRGEQEAPLPAIAGRSRERPEHLRFGAGPACCVLLRCHIEVGYISQSARASRAVPKVMPLRAWTGSDSNAAMAAFAFRTEQLRAGLDQPGGLALASAFASLQLCQGLKQWSRLLWGDIVPDSRSPNTRRIAMIIREMRAHPDHDWTVPDMGRQCGLSRSAFAAAFAAITGVAPMEYLTQERMKKAAQLLANPALSMREVGSRVGYAIESSFARAFRRHWGVAPRHFDQANAEQAPPA